MKKNFLVAQSGGPTAAINASLAGVISAFKKEDFVLYGAFNGIAGFLSEDITQINNLSDDEINLLKITPAAALGSCRYRLENSDELDRLLALFKKYDIGHFFYIGGNDSMDTVLKLSDYFQSLGEDIKVIGIPKTIDNDLDISDHSPGYGSAARFVATAVKEIIRDTEVYKSKTVTIIEVMGRNSGWLTMAAGLPRFLGESRPQLVYLPEVTFDIERFYKDVEEQAKKFGNVVIAVSEGIRDKEGRLIGAKKNGRLDSFSHNELSGAGRILENLIRENFSYKSRSIELNILQRCAGHIASATDIEESFLIGEKAAEYALQGKSGIMMIFKRLQNHPYKIKISCEDIHKIANKEKNVPLEFITDEGNHITKEAFDYIYPLLSGHFPVPLQNELPAHFKFKRC